MLRFGLIVLCVFLAGNLTAQKKSKRPSWVDQSPPDGLFYYGIGISSIRENPTDFRTVAQKLAIQEIARKIWVNVRSSSELQINSNQLETRYLLSDNVETQTVNYF
jgi:hypothetical protein